MMKDPRSPFDKDSMHLGRILLSMARRNNQNQCRICPTFSLQSMRKDCGGRRNVETNSRVNPRGRGHYQQRLVKADGSRQASDKGEKTENGDEKQLETVSVEAKGEFLTNNVATDGSLIHLRLGGPGQESGKGGSLLALKIGQTIFIDKYLVLCQASLGGFLVVEGWWRSSVDGGVEKDGSVFLVASSRDASKLELLGRSSERGVSLARWWGLCQ